VGLSEGELHGAQGGVSALLRLRDRQGRTLGHFRAQLERLQDTFMSQVGLHGGQKSLS